MSRVPRPSKEEIKEARKAAGITQTEAAVLVCTTCRVFQQWEAGERTMHAGLWKLFKIEVAK